MAAISTILETITPASAVVDVLNLVVEKIGESQREQLSQWLKLIEEHADSAMRNLAHTQLKRRKIEVVAAAAIYDAFLEFESRTGVKIRLPQLQETLGQSQCSINTTWMKLFDNRGSLRGEELDIVYVDKNGLLADAIANVMQAITKAVDGLTPIISKWLENIRTEAIEVSQSISEDVLDRYDFLTEAVTIIYAAIQFHHGKMQVRISQRDLSLLSGSSPAMISKCWIDLFENR